jgi:UDP-3-O-[3-hydroxymyristoyl] glucosamine N-acyltransferase
MQPKLIIFGNNSFAAMVAHHFTEQAGREVVAFTVHGRFISTVELEGRPILPFETLAEKLPPAGHELFVALEHGRQNTGRADVIAQARALGYSLPSFISPTASISSHARIGDHCLILDQVVIQYGVVIGHNNFILANSMIGQSCKIGDHNYFGSTFFADRHVTIGSYSTFGSAVRIAEALNIHDFASIHAFETITESIPLPTIIHPILRRPGYVIDRRQPKSA